MERVGALQEIGTGVPDIDVEHQLQVRLVEGLRRSVAAGQGRDVQLALLRQLRDASNVHFMSEELLMRLHAWDGYEQHLEEHRRLLDELGMVEVLFDRGSPDAVDVALAQLQAWLTNHVGGMDRAFADHVRRARRDKPPVA